MTVVALQAGDAQRSRGPAGAPRWNLSRGSAVPRGGCSSAWWPSTSGALQCGTPSYASPWYRVTGHRCPGRWRSAWRGRRASCGSRRSPWWRRGSRARCSAESSSRATRRASTSRCSSTARLRWTLAMHRGGRDASRSSREVVADYAQRRTTDRDGAAERRRALRLRGVHGPARALHPGRRRADERHRDDRRRASSRARTARRSASRSRAPSRCSRTARRSRRSSSC